jgi:hypothetical protein
MTLTEVMITALFNGIGTATGLTLFELYIKPRIHKIHEHTENLRKQLFSDDAQKSSSDDFRHFKKEFRDEFFPDSKKKK